MDYDASKYNSWANDAQQPAQHLIELMDQHLKKLNHNQKKSNLIILDLGCGPGNTTEMLAQHYSDAFILGVDIDPKMIHYAQKKQIPKAQFFIQNIERPWSEWLGDLRKYQGKIDIIFSNYTLHWIKDTDSLADSIRELLRKPSGFFTGNLLYCGWLQEVASSDREKSLLDRLICYPNEKEFVSNLIWSFRNKGDIHWMNIEYQEPISRYPRKFYSESFIEIPLKWYRRYLNKDLIISDEENSELNETIKRLILKQRICKVVIPETYPNEVEQIDIKQQLWIFQVEIR